MTAPPDPNATIQLGHGSGGVLMHRLLEQTILPALDNRVLRQGHDSAVLDIPGRPGRLAFTTDSYVVQPRFFPGGDIGTLAVNGTVNDLDMAGARPLCLSAALILEEGMPIGELQRVLASMKIAADAAGVAIVTGDTKVVDRGHGDGLYINTSGIGIVGHGLPIGAASIRAGDVVLLSGDIGRHGICILAEREKLAFETTIESDTAALHAPVLALIEAGLPIHCLRDLTRGGLASALHELMLASGLSAETRESEIPVAPQVKGACELLGLDPLYVANEGKLIAICGAEDADRLLAAMQAHALGERAAKIGVVTADPNHFVQIRTGFGGRRMVDWLSGEQLPRIC